MGLIYVADNFAKKEAFIDWINEFSQEVFCKKYEIFSVGFNHFLPNSTAK